ncbi:UNVERIFIED_ORG: hypothetical protein M2435_005551, partial [Rhizobium sophorae]|uniref:hypothetical protein n=1 Tax=Rhizobium leguminosarum TaxID=384 RepID=UPI001AEDA415
QSLDQTLIRKPYLEVAHFSVEKPAQFRMETNKTQFHRDSRHCPDGEEQRPSNRARSGRADEGRTISA